MTEANQVPLVELLAAVPADIRIGVDDGNDWKAGTTWHPVGLLCHKAAAELRRLHAENEELDALRDQAADELRRQHAEIERLGNLCYDYIGKLTALRAAKQMRQRIDELKGLVRDWVPVSERLPKPGQYVLAVFRYSTGKQVVIRAMHAPRHALSEDDYGEFVTEGADYDEATDTTYWPEGWYECNENEETHWQVHEEVTHWMPLPAAPSVGEKPDAA